MKLRAKSKILEVDEEIQIYIAKQLSGGTWIKTQSRC